jgi:hypothetical protein
MAHKRNMAGPMHGKMDTLVSWKQRSDKFQDSDSVSGMGDQVEDFSEHGSVQLTGAPKGVRFIAKDETNASCMRKMKMKRWF